MQPTKPTTAAQFQQQIDALKQRIADLGELRQARVDALAEAQAAQAERDRATLAALTALQLDADVGHDDVAALGSPHDLQSRAAGGDLVRALAAARAALTLVVCGLVYRIKHGPVAVEPDAELAARDTSIGRARAELGTLEAEYARARAAAEAFLAAE